MNTVCFVNSLKKPQKANTAEVIRISNHDHKNQPFLVEASSTIDTISDKEVKI